MDCSAEDKVSKFYNTVGWCTDGENTEDAKRWEDLREHARSYVSKCRLRVLNHIPNTGDRLLDMASGPIQYKEYLGYSKNFNKRYCVDLSSAALEVAKRKIGDHGVFWHGSFFDIPMEENFFDCVISLHTIYHIDRDKQEEAVRKLVHVTKPGKPIIIVYSNPGASASFFFKLPFRMAKVLNLPLRSLREIKRLLEQDKKLENNEGGQIKDELSLYFYCHPLEWWNRFGDVADIEILPWRSLRSGDQKFLIPNNKLGGLLFNVLFTLENAFPTFFVNNFQYPMIIMKKKELSNPV